MKTLKLALCGIAALSLGGCAFGLGNSFHYAEQPHTTAGQEFMDLKRAKEEGLISDEEYTKLKAKIMKRYLSNKSKKDKDLFDN